MALKPELKLPKPEQSFWIKLLKWIKLARQFENKFWRPNALMLSLFEEADWIQKFASVTLLGSVLSKPRNSKCVGKQSEDCDLELTSSSKNFWSQWVPTVCEVAWVSSDFEGERYGPLWRTMENYGSRRARHFKLRWSLSGPLILAQCRPHNVAQMMRALMNLIPRRRRANEVALRLPVAPPHRALHRDSKILK